MVELGWLREAFPANTDHELFSGILLMDPRDDGWLCLRGPMSWVRDEP